MKLRKKMECFWKKFLVVSYLLFSINCSATSPIKHLMQGESAWKNGKCQDALFHFQKAYHNGNHDACENLVRIYSFGCGNEIKQDKERSKKYAQSCLKTPINWSLNIVSKTIIENIPFELKLPTIQFSRKVDLCKISFISANPSLPNWMKIEKKEISCQPDNSDPNEFPKNIEITQNLPIISGIPKLPHQKKYILEFKIGNHYGYDRLHMIIDIKQLKLHSISLLINQDENSIKFSKQLVSLLKRDYSSHLVLQIRRVKSSKQLISQMLKKENFGLGIIRMDMKANKNIRLITPIYSQDIILLGNKNIKSIQDLTGKIIGVLSSSSDQDNLHTIRNILSLFNVKNYTLQMHTPHSMHYYLFKNKLEAMMTLDNLDDFTLRHRKSSLSEFYKVISIQLPNIVPDSYKDYYINEAGRLSVKTGLVTYNYSNSINKKHQLYCQTQLPELKKNIFLDKDEYMKIWSYIKKNWDKNKDPNDRSNGLSDWEPDLCSQPLDCLFKNSIADCK